MVFRIVTPCTLVDRYQNFGGMYFYRVQRHVRFSRNAGTVLAKQKKEKKCFLIFTCERLSNAIKIINLVFIRRLVSGT